MAAPVPEGLWMTKSFTRYPRIDGTLPGARAAFTCSFLAVRDLQKQRRMISGRRRTSRSEWFVLSCDIGIHCRV